MTTYGKIINNKLVLATDYDIHRYNNDMSGTIAKREGFYPVDLYADIKEGYKIDGYKIENKLIVPNIVKDIHHSKWQTYADKRYSEYPPIEEQLDMIYWDKINGTDIWEQTISAIKEKYPKNNQQSDYNETPDAEE